MRSLLLTRLVNGIVAAMILSPPMNRLYFVPRGAMIDDVCAKHGVEESDKQLAKREQRLVAARQAARDLSGQPAAALSPPSSPARPTSPPAASAASPTASRPVARTTSSPKLLQRTLSAGVSLLVSAAPADDAAAAAAASKKATLGSRVEKRTAGARILQVSQH